MVPKPDSRLCHSSVPDGARTLSLLRRPGGSKLVSLAEAGTSPGCPEVFDFRLPGSPASGDVVLEPWFTSVRGPHISGLELRSGFLVSRLVQR